MNKKNESIEEQEIIIENKGNKKKKKIKLKTQKKIEKKNGIKIE